MGAYASCNLFNDVAIKAKYANLPSDPLIWTDTHVKSAAEIMFNAYDKDQSGTVDREELGKLFEDSGWRLADFGTRYLDVAPLLDNLLRKYDQDDSSVLSFSEFFPLFKEMVSRMAQEGFIEKKSLPKFQEAIKAAIAETRVLVVSLDYRYDKKLELSGIIDGKRVERMARSSGMQDITVLFDDQAFSNRNFPLKKNVKRQLQAIGKRCRPNDVFVFFFSGHGINVPDETGDEEDGQDEAFGTPNKNGELDIDNVIIDDEFAKWLNRYIPTHTRILVITDCCHSGSICDIDTFNYQHEIVHISSSQDNQCSLDMISLGATGGVLTCAIGNCTKEFLSSGKSKTTVAEVYNDCIGRVAKDVKRARHCQDIGIQHANIQPHEFPWPFACSF